jgi:hypothetical protein
MAKYTTYIIFNDTSRRIDKIGAFPENPIAEELMIEQLEEVQSVVFYNRSTGSCRTYEDIKKIKEGTLKILDLHYSYTTTEYNKAGQKMPKVKRAKAIFA